MGFEWPSKIKFKSKTIILIARPVARGGGAAAPPCRPAEPSKIVEKVTLFFKKFACGGHFDTHKLELTCNSSATGNITVVYSYK